MLDEPKLSHFKIEGSICKMMKIVGLKLQLNLFFKKKTQQWLKYIKT